MLLTFALIIAGTLGAGAVWGTHYFAPYVSAMGIALLAPYFLVLKPKKQKVINRANDLLTALTQSTLRQPFQDAGYSIQYGTAQQGAFILREFTGEQDILGSSALDGEGGDGMDAEAAASAPRIPDIHISGHSPTLCLNIRKIPSRADPTGPHSQLNNAQMEMIWGVVRESYFKLNNGYTAARTGSVGVMYIFWIIVFPDYHVFFPAFGILTFAAVEVFTREWLLTPKFEAALRDELSAVLRERFGYKVSMRTKRHGRFHFPAKLLSFIPARDYEYDDVHGGDSDDESDGSPQEEPTIQIQG